jgi:hypothetical protein
MNPADVSLIEQIQQATRGVRMLLCTLARRGKALERDQPQRAAFLLTALRPHPLYKGGRLAFDMLEIEDLMLDAPPVDPLNDLQLTQVLSAVAGRGHDLAEVLLRFGSDGRDGGARPETAAGETALPTLMVAGPEATAPTALLPRVRFGPAPDTVAATDRPPARDGGPEAPESGPELLSSDYLYDYVVLGLLNVFGRAIAAELQRPR